MVLQRLERIVRIRLKGDTTRRYDLGERINEEEGLEIIDGSPGDLIVDVSDNANLNVVERVESARNVSINIGDNAKVTYYIIEGINQEADMTRKVLVGKESSVDFKIFSLNTGKLSNTILVDIDGENSEVNYKLVVISGRGSENTVDVRINNNAPGTISDIWQKGVVFDAGSTNLIATGYISKGSDNASSFQESRILLLDSAGRSEASPNLLIDHFNVEAGHKASVSRVNEDAMYYLNTRGISKSQAERLMIRAFIAPLIDSLELEDIHSEIEEKIRESLSV